jgi:ribosomal protein S18 acetylase RimI-like enzyme
MSVEIAPLREEDIPALIALARDIWHRHYPSIISVEQIEYMLAQRYTPEVIRAQLRSGRAWWEKLLLDGVMVAFSACEPGEHEGELKLDKLYVRCDLHGRGYGSLLLRNAQQRARQMGCRRLYLQVNRHNRGAIETYLRNGFVISREAKFDIGHGFIMDDYVMSMDIDPEAGK